MFRSALGFAPIAGIKRANALNDVGHISEDSSAGQPLLAEPDVLVIALDGGLLPNPVSEERYWAEMAGRFANPARKPQGSSVDIASLPYRDRVIAMAEDARAEGKRVYLETGTSADLGPRIAAQLGLFDGMIGPGQPPPSSEAGYIYVGEEGSHDLWHQARHVVTVDAPPDLRRAADRHKGGASHVGEVPDRSKAFLRALRPHQWLKNVLIFLPVLASHQFDIATVTQAVLAFLSFCLVASSVYLLNDLLDLSADRRHPRKRNRPFASGALPLAFGRRSVMALLIGGLAIATLAGPLFILVLVAYYIFTLLYSFSLKRRAIIDICTLAGLYTLRIVAGAAATGIALSVWLLAFSIFLFLSLAAMKRQAELVDTLTEGGDEVGGRGYTVKDLPLVSQMAISSGYLSVLVMALYLNSPDVQVLYSQPLILWGVCLVLLYWVSRAVFKTHRGEMEDDPIVFALKDRISRVCVLLVLAILVVGAVI